MKKKNNLESRLKKEYQSILFNIIFAFLIVLVAGIFHKKIWLSFTILSVITIIAFIKWKSTLTLLIFLFGAFWGPLSEMVCITLGAWEYTNPNFFSIPVWLFIVWGDAAAFLYQTSKEIHNLGVKK